MAPTAIDDSPKQGQQRPAETSIDYSKTDYKYSAYLPYFTPGLQPPLQEFAHGDPGHRADPAYPNLTSHVGISITEITPNIGTEITGLQLSSLTASQKDELALLAAERGVRQREFGRHFGPLHIHQMGGHIRDYPEILPVYRDFVSGAKDNEISNNVSSVKWHSDMSYEVNGMGTTIFYPLEVPPSGGDTLYLSTIAAYEHLSEDFRTRLAGLKATHSGFSQAAVHDHRDRYIREPIETVHPVVRAHPVTKKKSLYVNRLYTRKIVGWKEEESQTILNFLYDHIEKGQDWHIRIHWTPGTVVVYDNRVTQHSALRDFRVHEAQTRRHMVRITPQAERPFYEA
ncbi:TauD/TfdA dioxygenase family protein [Aspergillus stella-maris]|uniref:TauD/TfdA dioxygenase family protein n=1 Tax=Aspergillus stella-maris TaxID=1810926 RepID=UPI003CCDCC92